MSAPLNSAVSGSPFRSGPATVSLVFPVILLCGVSAQPLPLNPKLPTHTLPWGSSALVLQKQLTGFIIIGGLLALAITLLITVWDHASQTESLGSLGDQTSLPSNRS